MKLDKVVFGLTLVFAFASVPAVAQENSPLSYTIQYTGRTFGYARMPDEQTNSGLPVAPADCEVPNACSLAAKAYRDLFGNSKPTLRLGMGDNFAPNLKARTFKNPQAAGGFCPVMPDILVPKDRYYFDGKQWLCGDQGRGEDAGGGNNTIDADNVAQFFITSQYDAVVPGKHDFYFGPERLRALALLLDQSNVQMLGANLIFSTSKPLSRLAMNTYPRVPARYADLPYSIEFGAVSPEIPDFVLPYKREFLVKNVGQLVSNVQICSTSQSNRDPAAIDPGTATCLPLLPSQVACSASGRQTYGHLKSTCAAIAASSRVASDEVYLFKDRLTGNQKDYLVADTNYLFCANIAGKTPAGKLSCKSFSVQTPFFGWDPQQRPYKLKSSSNVAVFGVVDPDLLLNVGRINYAYLDANEDHGFLKPKMDIVVAAAPADYSLLQALEGCNSDDQCRMAHKVLMAQMSWAKAGQLISRLGSKFDLAISQSDQDHDTGDTSSNGTVPIKSGTHLLLTPADPTSEREFFVPKVSAASLKFDRPANCDSTRLAWTLVHSVKIGGQIPEVSASPCTGTNCITLSGASHAALAAQHLLTPAISKDLEYLALVEMRKALKTDVAFLQKRDLFNADALSGLLMPRNELQNKLQTIFWKGDFATPFYLKGATLRKIMKQSKKFADLDKDALSTETERGRELIPLGLFADPLDADTYYVNGNPMDDSALYSVAATQYLALGDTGYTDLATPDVPPPYRIEDFKRLMPIASLVCHAINEANKYGANCDVFDLLNPGLYSTQIPKPKPHHVDPRDFFDPSDRRLFDRTPGFNTLQHYKTLLPRLLTDGGVKTDGPEGRTQQRGFLSINLENLDLSYTGAYINHIQSAGNFAGISATGVTTTGSNSVNEDHRIRAIYDFRRVTFYGVSDSTLMRSSTSLSSVPTLSANTLGFEGGGTLRLIRSQRPTLFSFQYSSRFQGQITRPAATAITPNATPTELKPQPFYLPVPQTSTLYGRLGLRFDHNDTWFESGLEEIDSRRILTQYQFKNGTECSPSATLILACTTSTTSGTTGIKDPTLQLNNQPTPAVSKADFLTGGAYVNFVIKFPIWSRRDPNRVDQSMYFALANKGDFFFNAHTDTPTQTRYLDKFTPSFSIPIYGAFSLTPKVDFILFENKVLRNHYRVVEPSLSLSYSFKWRDGMGTVRALGFGAITTTPGTAGSLPLK